jgi:hypothetical protein
MRYKITLKWKDAPEEEDKTITVSVESYTPYDAIKKVARNIIEAAKANPVFSTCSIRNNKGKEWLFRLTEYTKHQSERGVNVTGIRVSKLMEAMA